jgi:hypothetical protein
MKKTMNRKTGFFSIGIAVIFLLVSFTSVISYNSVRSSVTHESSPLFRYRLNTTIQPYKTAIHSSDFVGKNNPSQIPLPSREILSKEILGKLIDKSVTEYILRIDSHLLQKWDALVSFALNNQDVLNRVIRQEYDEYYALFSEYSYLTQQEAKDQFVEMLQGLNLQDIQGNHLVTFEAPTTGNITSGVFCNITSGQICQITSQPICQITTQPICLLTKGFFCWTIYGPICPTTGIKCHPPTSRPTLCALFATAGKILKSIILVLLLATVIFVPIAILSLVFITVSNPDRCDQIHDRITMWFNCTTPE